MSLGLFVLTGLDRDELFASFSRYVSSRSDSDFCNFVNKIYASRAENNLTLYIENLIVSDDNVFARTCATNDKPSAYLINGFISDLKKIYEAISSIKDSPLFSLGKFYTLSGNPELDATALSAFYRDNGYGQFILNRAFIFDGNGISPVAMPSTVTLEDLKDYLEEKKIVLSNIENFLTGLPHSNMLLYGERGTGKSSTIHAIVNKFFSRKLRIVEVKKENLFALAKLKAMLASVPMRFIVFIDDLSLPSGDERISTLKATLEGTLEGNSDNTMIVATSNRRHIVDEKFSVRNDSVHAGDSMQEELSLSDRFGISVLFASTTKPQYLSIVRQLAVDFGITTPTDTLELLAERWAIAKGGRSPRRAKQFVSMLSSAESRGAELEF